VLLAHHRVDATGGATLERELGLEIHRPHRGPLGGDRQIGATIVENRIDFLILSWDPLEPMPHDPDVKALLRMMDCSRRGGPGARVRAVSSTA
jgi:methylglyoxal synthase